MIALKVLAIVLVGLILFSIAWKIMGWLEDYWTMKLKIQKEESTSRDDLLVYHGKFSYRGKTSDRSYAVRVVCGAVHVYSHPEIKELGLGERSVFYQARDEWMDGKITQAEIEDIKKEFSADNYRKAS